MTRVTQSQLRTQRLPSDSSYDIYYLTRGGPCGSNEYHLQLAIFFHLLPVTACNGVPEGNALTRVCLSFFRSVCSQRRASRVTTADLFKLVYFGDPPGLSFLPSALSPPQTVQTCSLYSHTSKQAVALLLKDLLVLVLIIIARKRSLGQGKVFYSHLSFCSQGGLCLGGPCPGESLSRGVSVQRGLCQGEPPCGKQRAVRILLECILVSFLFF